LEPKLLEYAEEDNILGAGAWNQSCLNMPKKTTSLELELGTKAA
jgi:hypothetical protein